MSAEPHVSRESESSKRIERATEAATWFAGQGFGIIAAYAPNGVGCTCPKGEDCATPGKHPVGADWQKKATRSPETIRALLGKRDGQYGVMPWPDERGLILDIDDHDEWPENVILPETFTVESSPGKQHVYLRLPEGYDPATLPATAPWGEIRVEGASRHVIGPYSRHVGGHVYAPRGSAIAEVSAGWLARLFPPPLNSKAHTTRPPAGEKVRAGGRHPFLRDRARALQAQGLTGGALEAAVWELNETTCDPPKSEDEVRRAIGDVETKFEPDEFEAKPKRKAARDRIIEYVEASGALLFSDPLEQYYAQVELDGRKEVIDLSTAGAGHWLTDIFMEQESGKAPDRDAIREACDVMKAHARKGERHKVHTRLGPLPDGDGFALDLGDDQWRAAVVRAGSWSIEPHPVMFRRGKKSAAIPAPLKVGDLSLLKTVLNLTDERTYRLIVGFLLGALNPKGVYSGLMLTGGPGAAKTTGARFIRRIIDPTERMSEVSSMPKKQDAFGTTARGSWVPAFDNVSALTPEQSDWLAQLATGYSTSDRTLYSDAEEFVISVCRPFIINGIDTADRGDLLSRVSTVELPSIDSFSTFDSLYESFDAEWPGILGGLLDVAASAVAEGPSLPTDGWRVRSADHVRWVTAGEAALGWEPRSYEAMIWEENQGAQEHALEALQWTGPLRTFLDRRGGTWTGTMTELLAELKDVATSDGDRLDAFGWPRSGKGMGDSARRAEPGLAVIGIRYGPSPSSRRGGRLYTWDYQSKGDVGDDGDVAGQAKREGDGAFGDVGDVGDVGLYPVRGERKEGEGAAEAEAPLTYRNQSSPSSPSSQPSAETAKDIEVELGLTDD